MKNSNLKGAFGALAVVGIALAVKKMSERKKAMKGIFEEYDIKGRTPFAFADKIRELDDEKYAELKGKLKEKFSSRCCSRNRKNESAEA
ncbi:hypothetical protein [Kaistella jeonii]|uniref:Uncharacterized protein n=1 Tax=Kaistella jeonii TaxID=266749 RepID=A0A0C1D9N2_9FLAO|nr:hypothetical protein [Kaistella jeonii]KIA90595.1 hypothetical protein OA86_01560 [Kaistella jeonii]SFB70339.1 hypothetical protein SAMN05421876_101212 [Kaistella jeonii]VEI94810.1 Uncharacterised protein [Kaistella jeonii]